MERKKDAGPWATWVYRLLQRPLVQGWMILLTISVLYCGDLIQALAEVQYDVIVSVLLWVCLVFFAIEWFLNIFTSMVQTPRYNFSLFFFLDFIATFSLIMDIVVLEANNLAASGPVARAARAARIGTRAGRSLRLMRLLRFVRLVRITRFVKTLLALLGRSRKSDSFSIAHQADTADLARADTLGAQIATATSKKVIIMTLILLTIGSLLQQTGQSQVCNGELVASAQAIYDSERISENCTKFLAEVGPWFNNIPGVVSFSQQKDQGLTVDGMMAAVVDQCVIYVNDDLVGPLQDPELTHLVQRRRGTEILSVPCDAIFINGDGGSRRTDTFFLYDFREEAIEEASFSMGITTVIIGALLVFSVIFASDAEGIANRLVVPIQQLMQDMLHAAKLELDKVSHGDNVLHSEVYEVRSLQTAFQNLHAAVWSFAKFTPIEVVRHFLSLGSVAQLGVVERNVSIFFSDIAGWTTICESSTPTQVLSLLSEYFESMVSIIIEEQGTTLEFIGDAILAIWNAPNDVPDHAVRGITTICRMRLKLQQLRRQWLDENKPEIRIRVGLHSSQVYVGNLGSNMRMKYGVLGDGVNLASHLEELNKRYKTEAMISEDALNEPGVSQGFLVRSLDVVAVKGRKLPMRVYEVLGPREEASEDMQRVAVLSAQAMRSYLARDFRQALHCLGVIEEIQGGYDPAGSVLADRCHQLLDRPPEENWNGLEVQSHKTF